jgi:type I restriction enzyme S subunit
VVWTTVKLGDVLTQKRARTPIEPSTEYKQITVRLWGKGLTLRGICAGSEIAAESQVAASAGDFLISKIDARHGAFGLVPDDLDGALVSNDFPCFVVNRTKIHPRFLEWFSKTERFVSLCKRASVGSTNRVRLAERRFLNLDVPLPSLDEQQAIAKKLDNVHAKLNERKTALEAVERDMHAMLFNAFQNIVRGAEWRTLAEVAPLVRRPVDVTLEGDYPELGVRSFGKGTFHKPSLTGADVGSKRLFEIRQGDLVFNIVFAWEGAIAVARTDDNGRVGSHRFLTCVPNSEIATAEFLRYYLLTPEGLQKVGEASPGGAGRNRTLGVKKSEAIRVPVPKIDVQRHFCTLCDHVERARSVRLSADKDADALIPAMLHEFFAAHDEQSGAAQGDSRSNVNSPPQTAGIDTPFKEAVLVGAIVQAFQAAPGQPLGNFRLQKAVYFARRYMGERALDAQYLRKAAGPYNPSMRYAGGIKIATEKKWVARARGDFGEGTALGPSATEMDAWIEKYQFAAAAAWVRDKFKFKSNDIWETLATVDYAMIALDNAGTLPTAAAILDYVQNDPEWHPKIAKLRLSKASIQNAMAELQSLFIGGQ